MQCTDVIVESSVDAFVLARILFAKMIISENVYKRVKDTASRDTNQERLDFIIDDIKDHVKYDASILTTFVDILRDLNRKDLADKILSKYEGIIHYEYM